MKRFVVAWAGCVLVACGSKHSSPPPPENSPPPSTSAAPDRVANLHAFAKLYGVVRWFHPSDSAAAVDWNAFAIDGARRVIDAPDDKTLRDDLRATFAQIAPTVRIAGEGEALADAAELHPAQAAGLDVIAWEHLGYGDSAIVSIYASKRRHRPRTTPSPGEEFATVTRAVDAKAYRGAKIRLRGKVRVAPGARAELWLRVDRPNGMGFFDNMMDRPVRATAWTDAEIDGTVADDATQIAFGPLLGDSGPAWFDAVTLEVEKNGGWQAIEIPAWKKPMIAGWNVEISDAGIVKVERAMITRDEELFDDAPRAGETIDLDLGRGLRARVPIALYSKDGHTIGDDPSKVTQPAPPTATGFDPIAGAADVIVVWNVLEHFWPYWDVVHVDWNAELDTALADALDDHSWDDHVATLERLSAAAPDGHANVQCAGAAAFGLLPFWIDQVEGKLIVIGSIDPQVKTGDELVAIDGRAAADALADRISRTSGSPQWKQHLALLEVGRGAPDTIATVRVRRDGKELDAKVTRSNHEALPPAQRPPVDHLDGGVVYVDLSRLDLKTIDLAALAKAHGVIFDMRGYPTGDAAQILAYVIAGPDTAKWMSTAHIVRPDHAATTWDSEGWNVTTAPPHINGKIVFLTGPGAISYAESMMGYAEAEHVAIVGATSAGTNGNI
ncbi:MAG TPA: hypothetical protein VL463_08435, partial [Kofleriaceae bacterium]|nr:hypothetical protein [Kofleriaceae bacterium]